MQNNDSPNKTDFKLSTAWIFFALSLAFVAAALAAWLGAFSSAASLPARLTTRTLSTDNVITSYEWFFDARAVYDSRTAQIRSHLELIQVTKDPVELARLRIELAGMRQSCREIANQYNANSHKANHGLFRDHDLPSRLVPAPCEINLQPST